MQRSLEPRLEFRWAATALLISTGGVLASCGDDTVSTASVIGDDSVDTTVPATPGDVPLVGPPPEVIAASKEWPLANRDYAGTRATFDSNISSENVATLTEAWSFELPAGGMFGSATSCALVLDGVVYYVDNQGNVFALDSSSGALRWEKRYDASGALPNGLAVGWGKVFVPSSESSFVALDAATGRELWKAPIEVSDNGGIGPAPILYDGLVYTSTEPVNSQREYFGGVNGTLYALNQQTGEIVWSFQTVQDSSLWGNAEVNSGGGAWYPPTIDSARSIMYWGIGNPGPYPGTPEFPLGSSRPGDNLYTNSVVALGLGDGKLSWYHQEAPHDLFDLDFQNPPIPVTITIDGVERHLVIGSGKTGTIAALDPDRGGELVWRTAVGKHENDTLTELPAEGVMVFPGSLGGIVTPLAYAEGVVFAPVVDWGRVHTPQGPGAFADAGTGELVAIDVTDGSVKWKSALPAPANGSVTVVNDLVLTSSLDGTVFAFERYSGAELWRYTAPLRINAPMTVVNDLLIIPAGYGVGVPKLIALRLP